MSGGIYEGPDGPLHGDGREVGEPISGPSETNVQKPLAERLRDSTAHTYSSENADLYHGFDNGRESAAVMVEAFAAEHLTEQTEPDQSLLRDIEYMLTDSGYCPSVGTIAEMIRDVVNATLRRVRELLVGEETK